MYFFFSFVWLKSPGCSILMVCKGATKNKALGFGLFLVGFRTVIYLKLCKTANFVTKMNKFFHSKQVEVAKADNYE